MFVVLEAPTQPGSKGGLHAFTRAMAPTQPWNPKTNSHLGGVDVQKNVLLGG